MLNYCRSIQGYFFFIRCYDTITFLTDTFQCAEYFTVFLFYFCQSHKKLHQLVFSIDCLACHITEHFIIILIICI